MRLKCPYCGDRDAQEFVTRGGAVGPRPDPAAPDARQRFGDWVHLRPNPRGLSVEYWYHAAGCRSWLRVTRDTLTHAVISAELTQS